MLKPSIQDAFKLAVKDTLGIILEKMNVTGNTVWEITTTLK